MSNVTCNNHANTAKMCTATVSRYSHTIRSGSVRFRSTLVMFPAGEVMLIGSGHVTL